MLKFHVKRKRRNKFGAKKTRCDGIVFDSAGEAKRYLVLKMLLRSNYISDLKLQPKFDLIVNDQKICTYKADFAYNENGQFVVEDFKGVKTSAYKLKKKLMKALYGIDIKETGKNDI